MTDNREIADSMMNALGYVKTTTPADELREAAAKLGTGSPVHAPGTARILHASDADGYDVLIAICDSHDDPDNPPPGSAVHGQCGNCVFVKTYDREFSAQLAALINAREPLAALLDDVAGEAERHAAHGMGNSQDEVADGPILDIARALNGTSA